ncbi:MAG: VOC family protein [Acidimicrobiia bacterium]|nr:VOC family protein [Acidimicrobiia bacterium]
MPRVTHLHHLAASTADMRGVIDFCTQVLGMELVGLFDMHGVPGGSHCFLRLNDTSAMSFVFLPDMAHIDEQLGVTHAAHGGDTTAPGTMQHVAFGVDSVEDLLAMRDRIRSHGYQVNGPIDHGFCRSIYFRGPEGLVLEVSAWVTSIDGHHWVDPAVAARCGIDEADLERFRHPPEPDIAERPVAQPAPDPAKPHLRYPEPILTALATMSDDEITAAMSFSAPPID